jgi:tRNA(Ile)-lysidine synthase
MQMLPRGECGRIIHPLLCVSKAELEDYMRMTNFEWREDSSNLQRKYKRNVLRLDVLPVMEQIAGGADPLQK